MLDQYSLQANAFPVFVLIFPIILCLTVFFPDGLKIQLGSASAVVSIFLAVLFEHIGAELGKRLETRLWQRWLGPPTVRFLRHSNEEFNAVTRQRIHSRLADLGFHIPSIQEQTHDAAAADTYWDACIDCLKERTRIRKDFPLVFKGLVGYGVKRNMLGLKPLALVVSVSCSSICIWRISEAIRDGASIDVPVVASLISVALCAIWTFFITERTVATAADRYAKYLLEAAAKLE